MYKLTLAQFNEDKIEEQVLKSASSLDILKKFDCIDWPKQIEWSFQESNQGEFLFFEIEDVATERKIGGLFMVYSRHEYNFHAHAELFQKQQKSHFFGLFKSQSLPSFDNDALPFEEFRACLELFLKGNDLVIEKTLAEEYPHYENIGIFDKT